MATSVNRVGSVDDPTMYIGCGGLISDGDGRYLLVRETKAVARGRLALPAGKLEVGESIPAAAKREVAEETGLQVALDGLLGVFHCERTSENSFGVNFVFAAHVIGGELTTSTEHPELVWLSEAEVDGAHAVGSIRGAHVIECVRRSRLGHQMPNDLITTVLASNL